MAGFFGKLTKVLLIGGGTILSFFNPALGAPLIVAGVAIKTKGEAVNTVDLVSVAAQNLNASLAAAQNMVTAGNMTLTVKKWYEKSPLLVLGGGAVLAVLLFKLLGNFSKRRR